MSIGRTQPKQSVFFYGLFMDDTLLRQMGLHPSVVGTAELSGFALRIGDRATLESAVGATSYGVLMTLPPDEIDQLYSDPSVADYRAESVHVRVATKDAGYSEYSAVCYNLPDAPDGRSINKDYARRLAMLAAGLGFPEAYRRRIEAMGHVDDRDER